MSASPEPQTPAVPTPPESEAFSLSTILAPGSSLHPTLLLTLDLAFAVLFAVLASLAIIAHGNIHLFALIAIELCLWASVKWVVYELQRTPLAPANGAGASQEPEKVKQD